MILNFVEDDPLLKQTKIDDEIYRTYHYSDGYQITVLSPVEAHIKAPPKGVFGGGSHRVLSADGTWHIIPAGWRHLTYKIGSCLADVPQNAPLKRWDEWYWEGQDAS